MKRLAPYVVAVAVLAIAGAAVVLAIGGAGNAPSAASKKSAPARGAAARSAPAPTRLIATVSATGHVTVTTSTSKGHALTRLHNGLYTVLVRVNSTKAGFHLTGPGVNDVTIGHGPVVTLWGIHFLRGTYRYRSTSDPRAPAHVIIVY